MMMDHIRQLDWFAAPSTTLVTESELDNCVTERIIRNKFFDPLMSTDSEDDEPVKIDWEALNKRKEQVERNHKVFVPCLRSLPPYPKLSSLNVKQHLQCLKVICYRNPSILPGECNIFRPTKTDLQVIEDLKAVYEKEQKEYIEWAQTLWTNDHCIRMLRPKPMIETLYDAEFKMRAHELKCFPKFYKMAAQIPLEIKNNVCNMTHVENLIDVNIKQLPQITYPNVIKERFCILKPCPQPEPCTKHPCRFTLPGESSMTILPLTEVHRELAHYAVENNAQCVLSENSLKCFVETDRRWMLPVSVCEVLKPDGEHCNVVVIGKEFSLHREPPRVSSHKAFRHLLEHALIPDSERAKVLMRISSPPKKKRKQNGSKMKSFLGAESSDEDQLVIDDKHDMMLPNPNFNNTFSNDALSDSGDNRLVIHSKCNSVDKKDELNSIADNKNNNKTDAEKVADDNETNNLDDEATEVVMIILSEDGDNSFESDDQNEKNIIGNEENNKTTDNSSHINSSAHTNKMINESNVDGTESNCDSDSESENNLVIADDDIESENKILPEEAGKSKKDSKGSSQINRKLSFTETEQNKATPIEHISNQEILKTKTQPTKRKCDNSLNDENVNGASENFSEYYSCMCKGSIFENPSPRSFCKWRVTSKSMHESYDVIVHCAHKARDAKQEVILEPIAEYQIDLGASEQSTEKLKSLALSLMLRKKATLLNVRVDALSGDVATFEYSNLDTLLTSRDIHMDQVHNTVHTALSQLQGLLPGHYYLRHEPHHGANALLFAARGGGEELRFDPHTLAEDEAKSVKTPPTLAPVLLPYHKFRRILPCAFTPFDNHIKEVKRLVHKKKTPPQALKFGDSERAAAQGKFPKRKVKKNRKKNRANRT